MAQGTQSNNKTLKQLLHSDTTKLQSQNTSWTNSQLIKINYSLLTPIINTMHNQNIFFKKQIQLISHDLHLVYDVIQTMLHQNQMLRKHFIARNQDVNHIIASFAINLNQQITDLQHQIHLIKQGNFKIFTQIQLKTQKNNDLNACVDQLNKKLVQLVTQSVTLKQKILPSQKIRLSSTLCKKSIDQLQKKQQQLLASQSHKWQQILELALQLKQLQTTNIKALKDIKQDISSNTANKNDYKANIIQNIMSVSQLKIQKDHLLIIYQKSSANSHQLANKQKELYQKYLLSKKTKQQKMLSLSKVQFQHEQISQSLHKYRQTNKQLSLQEQTKQQQRQKLKNEILIKKKLLKDTEQKHKQQKAELQKNLTERIKQIKQKININNHQCQKQIIDINYQKQCQQNNIISQKQQLHQLQLDYQNYYKLKNQLHNPIKEVQKAHQMLQNKNKNKPKTAMSIFRSIF